MPRLLAALLALPLLASQAHAGETFGYDLPKAHPPAYKALRALLPKNAAREAWVGRMDGTSSPLQTTAGGRLSGYVCQPHDCMSNKLAFVVSADGSRASGILRSDDLTDGREVILGTPDAADLATLRRTVGRD